MTVQELIEILEQMPPDAPVVVDGGEVTEIVIRDEMYFDENYGYKDGVIVKIY